jgi:hypothetical protein
LLVLREYFQGLLLQTPHGGVLIFPAGLLEARGLGTRATLRRLGHLLRCTLYRE